MYSPLKGILEMVKSSKEWG